MVEVKSRLKRKSADSIALLQLAITFLKNENTSVNQEKQLGLNDLICDTNKQQQKTGPSDIKVLLNLGKVPCHIIKLAPPKR